MDLFSFFPSVSIFQILRLLQLGPFSLSLYTDGKKEIRLISISYILIDKKLELDGRPSSRP